MGHRPYPASSSDTTINNIHRRTKSYDPNSLASSNDGFDEESTSIPLTATHYADNVGSGQNRSYNQQAQQISTASAGPRVGRSLSLFRRNSRKTPGQVYAQGTVPPVPTIPIHQHSGKSASRLLRMDDPILIRIAHNLELNQLLEFSHLSKRCRAIAAMTLTIMLQRTVLKATLCQERKAVFSLEFIFQHLDPGSFQAVFRANQLKSRRYFENSALARPVVQALTLVTPNGAHHPVFRLAGFKVPKGTKGGILSPVAGATTATATTTSSSYTMTTESGEQEFMSERDLERATTLLARPFQLDIKDKGYYRVSPSSSYMVDTPFFPSQPLLDPLVPSIAEGGAAHGPPSWEMMYKVDLNPPNYPQRIQQQQEKIHQERVRQAELNGEQPPPPPLSSATGRNGAPATGFVPLPAIKSGPNLRSILPEPSPLSGLGSDAKGGAKVTRKPTVVRPPPEGWGPLPPVAPPPAVPASLTYQLGARTVPPINTDSQHHHHHPGSPTHLSSGGIPKSPTGGFMTEPSCLEPELAEETERFLTLLFIQFPIQTLFPLTAQQSRRQHTGGLVSGWMSKSKIGRSLTMKKRTDNGGNYSVVGQ
ncbi:hypothetical protein BG004_000248 [Podila humilis]|nr:hypothetical protein BG004_000248 [Podila humilis]